MYGLELRYSVLKVNTFNDYYFYVEPRKTKIWDWGCITYRSLLTYYDLSESLRYNSICSIMFILSTVK